jgi:hypothetical protein
MPEIRRLMVGPGSRGKTRMPKPVLQAMVLADNVYVDAFTGKHVIAGTFTAILAKKQESKAEESLDVGNENRRVTSIKDPRSMGSPCLYLALFEVHGQVPIELRYINLSDSSVVFTATMMLAAADPVAVAEYAIPVPQLPSDKAGEFSLDALFENELLGSWRISVRCVDEPSSEGR